MVNDATLADALLLLTRVNTKLFKKLEKLDNLASGTSQTYKKQPEQVLEKPQPVEIESFGKKAVSELGKVFKTPQVLEKKSDFKKVSEIDWLKLLKSTALTAAIGAVLKEILDSFLGDENKEGTFKAAIKGFSTAISGLPKAVEDMFENSKILKAAAESLGNLGSTFTKSISEGFEKAVEKLLKLPTATAAKSAEKGILQSAIESGAKAATKKLGKSVDIPTTNIVMEKLGEKGYISAAKHGGGAGQLYNTLTGRTLTKELSAKTIENMTKQIALENYEKMSSKGVFRKGMSWLGEKTTSAVERTGTFFSEMGAKTLAKLPGGANVAELLVKYGPKIKTLLKFGGSGLMKVLKFLGIPGVADTFFAAYDINDAIKKFKTGEYNEFQFKYEVNKGILRGGGSTLGGILGSLGGKLAGGSLAAAATVGSGGLASWMAPFLYLGGSAGGTLLGSFLGDQFGVLANWLLNDENGKQNAEIFDTLFGYYRKYVPGSGFLQNNTDEFMKKLYEERAKNMEKKMLDKNTTKVEDVVISANGEIIEPSTNDTLYAIKHGGPLDKFFDKNIKVTVEGNDILKKYSQTSTNLLIDQLKTLNETNKLLAELKGNLSNKNNIISQPTIVNNNFNSGVSLRGLQGAIA